MARHDCILAGEGKGPIGVRMGGQENLLLLGRLGIV